MKKEKGKYLIISMCLIIIVIVTIVIVACMNGKDESNSVLNPTMTGGNYVASTDYSKLSFNLLGRPTMVEAEDGFYSVEGGMYLRYYDKKAGKATVVCNKPNCDHSNTETCGGAINAFEIQYYNGKIYFTDTFVETNDRRLMSINADGSNEKVVQILEDNREYMYADNASFIIHRGIVYYILSTGEVMANELGGKLEDAIPVFNESLEKVEFQNGVQVISGNTSMRMLYADGENIYLRLMEKVNNSYVETFYQYNVTKNESKQVFQIPTKEIVGEWEETGVKSEGWYIEGNDLYYFLSENGLWKYNFETRENKKIIDLQDVRGFATIDGEHLYINNGNLVDETSGLGEVSSVEDFWKSDLSDEQVKNLSIKIYNIETANYEGEIKYSDIWNNGKYRNFKIAALTSDGILIAGENIFDATKSLYYANRENIKESKFKHIDLGEKINDQLGGSVNITVD